MKKGLVLLTIAAMALSSAPVTTWASETNGVTAEESANVVTDAVVQEDADAVADVSAQDGTGDVTARESAEAVADAVAQEESETVTDAATNVGAEASEDVSVQESAAIAEAAAAQEDTESVEAAAAQGAEADTIAPENIVTVEDGTAEAMAEAIENPEETSEQMPLYESSSTVSPNVTTHTQDEIKSYVASHGGTGYTPRTYAVEPSTTSPYAAGLLSDETLQNALNRLNQMRYIAGLDEVTLNDTYTEMVQAGTLVNAVNGVMSHFPTQPEDMSDELYELGLSGCSSANLYWSSGSAYPESAISGWMNDSNSSNIDCVGHRRWILNPYMGQTGFGSTGGYQAMYAFDESNTSASQSLVTWPAQNMPVEYFGTSVAWSISVGAAVDEDSVEVTLTRRSDGKVWTFSSDSSDGDFYVNNDGYGVKGAIIFRPSDIDGYYHGDIFDVSITGLSNPISYSVSFFALEEANEEVKGTATVTDWSDLKSTHDYASNMDYTKIYTTSETGVASLTLTFSESTQTESGYDYIYLYDGSDNLIGKYSGTQLAGQSVTVSGKTVKIKMTSDSSRQYWGYEVTNLVANKAPSSVTGLKIGGRATDALRLNWTQNASADGYIIEQYKDGEWSRIKRIGSNSRVTCRVEGLSAGTTYQFRIRAFKLAGSSALYSGYKYINGKTKPATVSGLKIGGRATDALRLNWTKNTGASGYIIEQYNDGSWTRIAKLTSGSRVTYRVENLSASTTYQFRIQAYTFDDGTALYSTYQTVSGTTAPTAVTGLKIGGRATNALRLNWTKNSKASGYIIEQYKDGSWTRVKKITSNSTVTYRVEGLSSNTTYKFRVRAFGYDGSIATYSDYTYVDGTTK